MRGLLRREKLAITGNWAEFVEDSEGHQFSPGRIYYHRSKKIYCFDGTNFNKMAVRSVIGRPLPVTLIESSGSFSTCLAPSWRGTGQVILRFGVVNLAVLNSALAPTDGHYVSANVDGKGMSHTMDVSRHIVPIGRR